MAEVLNIKKRGKASLAYAPQEDVDISDDEYKPKKREGFSLDDQILSKIRDLKRAYKKRLGNAVASALDTTLPKKRPRVDFLDTLAVYSSNKTIKVDGLADDFERELGFYQFALENAKVGVEQLEKRGVEVWRPDDYMVEMYKDDHQMHKIKVHLKGQAQRIEAVTKRRSETHNKKFAKAAKKQGRISKKIKTKKTEDGGTTRKLGRNRVKKTKGKNARPGKARRAASKSASS